jgi:hypothetical protein
MNLIYSGQLEFSDTYHIIHIQIANMHWQGIACSRLFYMGSASAEGKKLECLIEQQIIF